MNTIVVDQPGFYVSYNGDIRGDPLGDMLDGILCDAFGIDKSNVGRPETALCIRGKDRNDIKFLILYDDHSKQYKEAAERGGLAACLDYFNAHKDQASHASEHESIEAKFK